MSGAGGGGGGLSKLAIVLIVIFSISLVALFAQLFYVLWRRRIFRGRTNGAGDVGGGDEVSVSQYSSSESNFSFAAHPKELFYFFCIRPHYRPEHDLGTANTAADGLNSDQQSDVEAIDIDLLKIHGIFGPPRFLFTIKEEEREDSETPAGKPLRLVETEARRELGCKNGNRAGSDDPPVSAAAAVEAETEARGVDDATPFSTPCGSPAYFTPEASPIHEAVGRGSGPGEVTFASGSA